MIPMKRLLPFLLALLAVGTFSLDAQERVRWKLAMTWGPTLSPFVDAVEEMASMVEEMSGGNFVIRIDASNKHKSPFGVYDMVKAGQYEMGHSASYYYKGKNIAFQPLTTMPFGMTAPEQYAWFYYGGGMELMEEAFRPEGLLAYPGGNTGNQMGGWFRTEINGLEDLEGLKMRIPGFAGDVFSELGVTVTNIPPGELYTSLERGTIDALEWVGPGMDIKMGFHKIAPYYYTGWHEPATELLYLVNEDEFNDLPENYQAMLVAAMKLSAYNMYAENYHMSAVAWREMAEEFPNIEVRTFPEEVIAAMKEANDALIAEAKQESPLFAKILESQEEYMEGVRAWTKISDYDYLTDNLEPED